MSSVLLIEDSQDLGSVIEQLLQFQGYDVMWGSTGTHGIGLLNTNPPDAIICDVMLPDMDGFAVIDYVRGNPDWQHIPIVIVSGAVSPEVRRDSMARGAAAFILKPFRIEELLSTLDSLALPSR